MLLICIIICICIYANGNGIFTMVMVIALIVKISPAAVSFKWNKNISQNFKEQFRFISGLKLGPKIKRENCVKNVSCGLI